MFFNFLDLGASAPKVVIVPCDHGIDVDTELREHDELQQNVFVFILFYALPVL